ncbi:mannose-6-phosphate isomerase [Tamaricihabitans halophyticus]|uniref:Mannose-6-phosphate isomerase n=1 Tax=Tamaricihabitans halophyticus TaxID=1262583 RepID=A0A4R2QIK7_9PSEU|nr:class I mannose-6-phosphate isomerase [Tamaricihabitans halophyticus]TCP48609.1 mannose-6-phosphate isomerase [Tamaricihabitans halophyticus]
MNASRPPTIELLPANQPPQFYRGGAAIAELRGSVDAAEFGPEDWVASATTLFGQQAHGLSTLADGRLLRDAVAADPLGWLGAAQHDALGVNTGLLVKLLHAGQRLPVHCHPDDAFARTQLSAGCGKTEAWVVVHTDSPDRTVYLGFREDQDPQTVAGWVAEQDSAAMLDALNAITVNPGDTVFVPAGVPHAIGAGVFIVELQQPTDLSITLEWQDFLPDAAKAHLGIGYPNALRCLDHSGWSAARLAEVVHRGPGDGPRLNPLPAAANPFFRAEWLRISTQARLAPCYGVLVALSGTATLRPESGPPLPIGRGSTVVIPHGAGETIVDGEITAVYCRPPDPADVPLAE